MKNKIGFFFIIVSLSFACLYGIDKLTSDNPSDSALIRIGLSNIDSSNCDVCELNEIYYDSGCKRCIQDGIVLTAHVSNERFYNLGWSKNNGMYYGDEQCDGSKNLEYTITNKNNTYYIEIEKNNQSLQTNFYTDENFSNLKENISIELCSNPTDLQYLRISNEDGKPPGNGGMLSGYIDDIEIFDSTKNTQSIFSSSFDECFNNTCNDLWTFRNPEKISIDTKINAISFSSEVLGTNDYAHLKLDDKLPNSWKIHFKLHIDELEEHPRGKGILKIDPQLRQIFFGIPALIFPFIGYGITRKMHSKLFGATMIVTGILILGGILSNQNLDTNNTLTIFLNIVIIIISILIIILGIFKIGVKSKKIRHEIND
jgi:hypothetical protein